MKVINYSIIIPHKNIPQLLLRCVSSIPQRDDTQIIIVDDNSNDQSIRFIQNYILNQFCNIEIIYNKVGQGGGYARNLGLSVAQGKWVLFADADDFFNYCINDVLNEYLNIDADIIYFNANSVNTDTYLPSNRVMYLNKMIEMYKTQKNKAIFNLKYAFGEPWCKLINRSIITNYHIQFDTTIIHNDTTFSYLSGFYSNKIMVDNRALYCVTDRIDSVSKKYSIDRQLIRTEVFSRANRFFRTHNIKRFDMKALRPLMHFLKHRDIKNYNRCMHILIESGMTKCEIRKYQVKYIIQYLKSRFLSL